MTVSLHDDTVRCVRLRLQFYLVMDTLGISDQDSFLRPKFYTDLHLSTLPVSLDIRVISVERLLPVREAPCCEPLVRRTTLPRSQHHHRRLQKEEVSVKCQSFIQNHTRIAQ